MSKSGQLSLRKHWLLGSVSAVQSPAELGLASELTHWRRLPQLADSQHGVSSPCARSLRTSCDAGRRREVCSSALLRCTCKHSATRWNCKIATTTELVVFVLWRLPAGGSYVSQTSGAKHILGCAAYISNVWWHRHHLGFRIAATVKVDVAEWLRRTPAKCVGSPAQVRILPSTDGFFCLTTSSLLALAPTQTN